MPEDWRGAEERIAASLLDAANSGQLLGIRQVREELERNRNRKEEGNG